MLAEPVGLFSDLAGGAARFLSVGCSGGVVLLRLTTLTCLVPGFATAVAVAYIVSPLTALGLCVYKGFISKSFLFLLPLPSLTLCTLIFQVFGLLNNTIDESVGVKDKVTMVSRDQELHCKFHKLIWKALQHSTLIFLLGNLNAYGH